MQICHTKYGGCADARKNESSSQVGVYMLYVYGGNYQRLKVTRKYMFFVSGGAVGHLCESNYKHERA